MNIINGESVARKNAAVSSSLRMENSCAFHGCGDPEGRRRGREEGEEVREGDREGGIGNRRLEPRARPLLGYRVLKRALIAGFGTFVEGYKCSFN